MKKSFFFVWIIAIIGSFADETLHAQLSIGGIPPSSNYTVSRIPDAVVKVPVPDLTETRKEDSIYPTPYCFGLVIPVDVDAAQTGSWSTLPDGTEIWRVMIKAPGALALTAYFDRFYIPEGGKLFIYDPDKSQVVGAFTSLNNPESGYFATELIAGDEMILEYSCPSGTENKPLIHLNELTYAYRGVDFLERYRYKNAPTTACEVNINCPEGNYWQYQKDGVNRIQAKRINKNWWCSGSVINNTLLDRTPYILTANHCGFNSTDAELQQWIFYFNYETDSCSNKNLKWHRSMTGAILKAHSGNEQISGSDFYLVQMNQVIPDSFHVFYNGWSRKTVPSPSGAGIHHPNGGYKKISTYSIPLISTLYEGSSNETHWQVSWSSTESGHGVTEGGSSGSPIFDNQGRIVGTLSGGLSACDSASLNLSDFYGKFSYSWASNGNSPSLRLKDWLDPTSTNVVSLDGLYLGIEEPQNKEKFLVYPNPFDDVLNIKTGLQSGKIKITIFDLPGRIAFSGSFQISGDESIKIDVSKLIQGIYLLKAENSSSVIITKIIKQ